MQTKDPPLSWSGRTERHVSSGLQLMPLGPSELCRLVIQRARARARVCARTPMRVYTPEIKWSWEQAVKLKDSSGEARAVPGIQKVQGSLRDEQVAW